MENSQPKLLRPVDGRMVGGVAAGIARALRMDATLVRAAFCVLALVFGLGLLIYLVGWAMIPEDRPWRAGR
jgi:phage shock protein PspC (stress-responsive transcriptional regulator)